MHRNQNVCDIIFSKICNLHVSKMSEHTLDIIALRAEWDIVER